MKKVNYSSQKTDLIILITIKSLFYILFLLYDDAFYPFVPHENNIDMDTHVYIGQGQSFDNSKSHQFKNVISIILKFLVNKTLSLNNEVFK